MNDPSLSEQATTPDQAVIASEQAQPLTSQNVQGSAMLDTNIEAEAEGNQPEGEPLDAPIATNFSRATATGAPKTVGANSEMGSFSTNKSAVETGTVNLHNNPNVPSDRQDSWQASLPDTDVIQQPTGADTNLPD